MTGSFAVVDDLPPQDEVYEDSQDDVDDMGSSDYSTVGRSAGLMTVLTIVSRVTGFIRTWAMAAAIGMSLLSSSYQVANNLPNMLYELVMGGMLVTAFLPVYMGVRREQGREASNEYVGNLLGILLLLLGGISLLGTVFAPGFIWTQSFLSGDGGSMDTAAFMFRFFAIQFCFMAWARCSRAFSTHIATTSGRRLPRFSTMSSLSPALWALLPCLHNLASRSVLS